MNVNHGFFESINTPEKAYVLGFWCADGYMTTPKKCPSTWEIGFVSADYEHLALIRDLMESSHRIKTRDDKCHRLIIGSKALGASLSMLGFNSNKSLTARYPSIAGNLDHHFIRGLFDGDGCITRGFRRKDLRPYLDIHFVGTEPLLNAVNERLPEVSAVRNVKANLWRLLFSQRKAFAVLEWFYKDSDDLRLGRKYERYIEAKTRTGFYLPTARGIT